jgi:hypothetical protein
MTHDGQISGWGRHPWRAVDLPSSESLEQASAHANLARGLGRAYGDAALSVDASDRVLATTLAVRSALGERCGLSATHAPRTTQVSQPALVSE